MTKVLIDQSALHALIALAQEAIQASGTGFSGSGKIVTAAVNSPIVHPVLQDWVLSIPLRQQGVLVLALRGPDGMRKESPAKPVMRSLRACAMNSGREGVPMALGERFEGDNFMRMDLISHQASWSSVCDDFFRSIDEMPLHFYQHLIHAAAVVGFNHPIPLVAERWLQFYHRGVDRLHMKPETREEFVYRLRNGDRGKGDE